MFEEKSPQEAGRLVPTGSDVPASSGAASARAGQVRDVPSATGSPKAASYPRVQPAAIELTSVQPAVVRRSPSPEHENALSESEEEQMRAEAQVGMLLTAASKNNVKRLRGLLNAGVPPSSGDYDQRTALHLACSEGHLEAAQLLIDEGANANAKDRFGSTPLDDAQRAGHHELVTFLRSKKAKHGGLDKLQAKLLEHCAKNELAQVQMLLAKDVNGRPVPGSACIPPNCCDYDKSTPLHLAVAEGSVDLVALLLANGADPNAVDRWGMTPLEEAERKAARVGVDPIRELFRAGGFIPPERESMFSFFSVFFGAWELMMMILIGLFCVYAEGAAGSEHLDDEETARAAAAGVAPVYQTRDEFRDPHGHHQAVFTRTYSLWTDVHTMIFVGFGFLMVFLRKHGYTSVGLTFLVSAFVIQWYQLCNGFWADAFTGEWVKIPLGLEQLILGDFAAGAVLISFGVLLGKVNPSQLLFISIIETIGFSLNERIGLRIGANDVGGSMTIHMFGAFFGIGASWMMTPKDAIGHENNAANYHSDTMAMIGTIFLWMFWPSFNSALCVAQAQERAVVNTLLALCGSCVVAFLASHLFRRERKFHMVDVQNATLAGGVAMGACADLLIEPGSALGIGGIAGLVSVLGYVYVQPYLEKRLGLHDTCGVNNLHGMPSIIGGFASVIAASTAHVNGFGGHTGYGRSQLANSYPMREGDAYDGNGRTASDQAGIQFAYMCTSFGISLVLGVTAGHFATLKCFTPTASKNMYVDSEYWEVPHLETPYYFDHRGEVSRGPDGTPLVVQAPGTDGEDGSGVETSKVVANLDAPDNAHLMGLIQALETRINQLTRRVGQAGTGASTVALPATTPITGLSAIPQVHLSKSAVPAGEAEYPPSKLAVSTEPTVVPSPSALQGVVIDSAAPVSTAASVSGPTTPANAQQVLLHSHDDEEEDEE